MKPGLYFISAILFLMICPLEVSALELSAGIRYGQSKLNADYTDPGTSVSADLALSLNSRVRVGFQFSRNMYQPLPACEIFGGNCSWEKDGEFNLSEYFFYIRVDSPHFGIIPAKGFLLFAPGYFRQYQNFAYSRCQDYSCERRMFLREIERMGFMVGVGVIFDDFKGLSIEFAPVFKGVDDILDHLDIYLGFRYSFS